MIIEFLGISGVGKTTTAKQYIQQAHHDGVELSAETLALYEKGTWLSRNLKKGFSVLGYAAAHPLWVKHYWAFLRENIHSFSSACKPLFNGIYLKSRLARARRDGRIHVFDEGAFQYLWALKLRGNREVTETDLNTIGRLLGYPDKLIVVEAEAETICRRLLQRGRTVTIMKEEHLLASVQEMLQVQHRIACMAEAVCEVSVIDNNEEKVC